MSGVRVNFTADFTAMNRAMDAVARESRRSGAEVVTLNARVFLRKLAYMTPGPPAKHQGRSAKTGKVIVLSNTGTGRAGWTPAWQKLRLPGRPYTRRGLGRQSGKISRYTAEGSVTDNRGRLLDPHILISNTSHVDRRTKSGQQGKYRYLFRSNQRGPNAGWMQRAVDATAYRFGQIHDKLLAKYSARPG